MAMNPLPPQAYTKETLMTAFAWLQDQSDSIKEMASNPDILVGLYLKAKLQGEEVLERPSIQNFKNELRNLAGMMGEFSPKIESPLKSESVRRQEAAAQPSSSTVMANSVSLTNTINSASSGKSERTEAHSLDSKSMQMIREIKEQFNLSSEAEALRLLISVGFQKVKTSL